MLGVLLCKYYYLSLKDVYSYKEFTLLLDNATKTAFGKTGLRIIIHWYNNCELRHNLDKILYPISFSHQPLETAANLNFM